MDSHDTKKAFIDACEKLKYFKVKELANNLTSFDFECQKRGLTVSPLLAVAMFSEPKSESVEIVRFLIQKGIKKLNVMDHYNGHPVLYHFIKHNNTHGNTIASLLIDAGYDIEVYGPNFSTPLITAIHYNSIHTVRKLIGAGCNINFSNRRQEFPISVAINSGRVEIANMLIDAGCDLTVRARYKGSQELVTPYEGAIYCGYPNIAKKIKEKIETMSYADADTGVGVGGSLVSSGNNSSTNLGFLGGTISPVGSYSQANSFNGNGTYGNGNLHASKSLDSSALTTMLTNYAKMQEGRAVPSAPMSPMSPRAEPLITPGGLSHSGSGIIPFGSVPTAISYAQGHQSYNQGFSPEHPQVETGTASATLQKSNYMITVPLQKELLKQLLDSDDPKITITFSFQ